MGNNRYLIEKQKIADNIRTIRNRVGHRRIYAFVKANGYGMGVDAMVTLCAENGLRHFVVTDMEKAETIRRMDVAVEEMLMMGPVLAHQVPRLKELGVTFTVSSQQEAEILNAFGGEAHIVLDTGMGRKGFYYEDVERIAALYETYPNIRFTGICTHFAKGLDRTVTQRQFARFQQVLQVLQERGIDVGLRHCCASPTLFSEDDMLLDGVRVGSAILGRVPGFGSRELARAGICQAMITDVRTLPKGATVGYGSNYRAPRQMRIAVCALGTHNGIGITTNSGAQQPWKVFLLIVRNVRDRLLGRSVPTALIHGKKCKA